MTDCPVILAHDGQAKQHVQRIVRRYNASVVALPSGMQQKNLPKLGLYSEMLLMLRACYVIGNPASTLAGNVARVRALLMGEGTSNLRSAAHRPFDAKKPRLHADFCYGMNK